MSKIPIDVQPVINDYANLLHERVPNTMEGLYIHGSIALNAYVKDSSDIDFITITNRRFSDSDIEALSEIHRTIALKYIKPELDGVYIPWEDIGKLHPNHHNSFPYYNDGIMRYGNYINPVTWWILKYKGIRLIGPDREALNLEIKKEYLLSYVSENMNSYWAGRVQRIEHSMESLFQWSSKQIDAEIEWSVLGLLRQYYTLQEHDIVSKLGAGEYGLLHLPEGWRHIVKEAINIRLGTQERLFTSDKERIESAIGFMKYIIDCCNTR